ncbi:hypothetical protein B0H10DRAFT_1952028 [Mycena sp. CBHHK59/15]|nr:hypothetical protein B0H10DRAFT_1952028 [Mycena sp. CBHHK59/15]
MLDFLSSWRRKDDSGSSFPTRKEASRRIDIDKIGPPTLRSIPLRFQKYAEGHVPQSTYNGPHRPLPRRGTTHTYPPPAAHYLPPARNKASYPLIRSYSLPTPVSSSLTTDGTISASLLPPAPVAFRNNRLSANHRGIRRPLSPIREQSYYASPVSLKPINLSPENEVSDLDLSRKNQALLSPSSRTVTCAPESIIRPTASVRHTLNKSETSGTSISSIHPPSIPPLNLAPPFPGPHPSHDGDGPPRRPTKVSSIQPGSSAHGYRESDGSGGSLHAESFFTATNSIADAGHPDAVSLADANIPSISARHESLPSSEFSHVERLERQGTIGSGGSLRVKCHRFSFATPAFCAFWLGFLFPPLWWVGGWYFTMFEEKPPHMTTWEYYVCDTKWWTTLNCGRKRKGKKPAKPPRPLLLPRWVGMNDPAASLKGISYYYPFVSRPVAAEKGHLTDSSPPPGFRRLHRLFDEVTHSRLAQVKLARESPRRMIDPWIERCRRALCYFCLAVLLFILAAMGWSFAVASGKAHY